MHTASLDRAPVRGSVDRAVSDDSERLRSSDCPPRLVLVRQVRNSARKRISGSTIVVMEGERVLAADAADVANGHVKGEPMQIDGWEDVRGCVIRCGWADGGRTAVKMRPRRPSWRRTMAMSSTSRANTERRSRNIPRRLVSISFSSCRR